MKNNQRNLLPKNTIIANERIEAREVRFTNADGESVVMPLTDALQAAYKDSLDLILINAKAQPPLCKIMEINKYLYEQKQKEKENKKKQRENLIDQKEIRMGLNIDTNDLATKANHVKKFLEHKAKVTVTIVLKGRERGKQDMARDLLNNFAELLEAEYEYISSQNNRVMGRIK
jgi:translation initiation factor IF-3